jgi:hypothetical protein
MEKEKAANTVRTEAFLLIQVRLSYTFNAWRRDTLAAIIARYGKHDHNGNPRGIGNSTFSNAVRSLVNDGLVTNCIDHYQFVLKAEDGNTLHLPPPVKPGVFPRNNSQSTRTAPRTTPSTAPEPVDLGSDEESNLEKLASAVALVEQQRVKIQELEGEITRLNRILANETDALRHLQAIYSNENLPVSVTMRAASAAVNFERSKPPSLSVSVNAGLAERLGQARKEQHAAELAGLPTPVLSFTNEPDDAA